MTLNRPIRIVLALLLLPAAVACQRGNDPVPATTDPGPAAAAAPEPSAPAAAAEAPVSLDDVIETDPRYVVGISYPPGAAADLCVFDPSAWWLVGQRSLASQGRNTPFLGHELPGRVRYTLVGGNVVHEA